MLPDVPAGTVTKRDRMIAHEAQPTCAACHQSMDPLGFALEHFDAVGAYRATESGLTIDTSGTMDGSSFTGSVDMGKILATSDKTAPCMARNLYTYAVGHAVPSTEEIVVSNLASSFSSSGNKLRALLLKIVASDGFTFVSPESP
jgi:hypothetical protein